MHKVSVVIVSLHGQPLMEDCLRALESQQGDVDIETIVVCFWPNGFPEGLKKAFPKIHLLQPSTRLGIPQLRALGLAEASGDIIAITEDCCIPADNWIEEIVKAHHSEYSVIGGAIENASTNTITNWAAYLCEYSQMLLPIHRGEVESIAGNNSSYKREIFDKINKEFRTEYWEYFLHQELRKSKIKILSVPEIIVFKKKEFGFLYFLSQKYHFSRSFAGMRGKLIPLSRRILSALFSPALPFLMTWRIGQQVFTKKRYVKEFLLSLPFLFIFMLSYAAGELTGYLLGSGKSLEKVE